MEYFLGLVILPAVLLAVVIYIYVRQRRAARAVFERSVAADRESLTSPSRPAWPEEGDDAAAGPQG